MSSATPVQQTLVELDVPHELVSIDLASGKQRAPEFLRLNPNGKVPTLLVDDAPMFEAVAIVQWLGDRYGVQRGLWPAADTPERLQALSWTTWGYVTVGAALQRFIHAGSERIPAELHHAGQREHFRKELGELLGILDARLQGRNYLLGDAFSLADLLLAGLVTYMTYCGVSTAGHADIEAWLERFQSRPSFQTVWAAA